MPMNVMSLLPHKLHGVCDTCKVILGGRVGIFIMIYGCEWVKNKKFWYISRDSNSFYIKLKSNYFKLVNNKIAATIKCQPSHLYLVL